MGCCGSLCGAAARTNGGAQEAPSSGSSSSAGGPAMLKKSGKGCVRAEVKLHVYDVRGNVAVEYMNNLFRMLGTGAFHVAVEVYGDEWSYGYMNEPPGCTGVFNCEPGQNTNFGLHRDSISLGTTPKDEDEVDQIIEELSEKWKGEEYDLLRHNCCYFSDAFCKRLEVGPFPDWIKNLAGAGAKLTDAVYKVTDIKLITTIPRNMILKVAKGEATEEAASEEVKKSPSYLPGISASSRLEGEEPAESTPSRGISSPRSLFTTTSLKGRDFVRAMTGNLSNSAGSVGELTIQAVKSTARKIGTKRKPLLDNDAPAGKENHVSTDQADAKAEGTSSQI